MPLQCSCNFFFVSQFNFKHYWRVDFISCNSSTNYRHIRGKMLSATRKKRVEANIIIFAWHTSICLFVLHMIFTRFREKNEKNIRKNVLISHTVCVACRFRFFSLSAVSRCSYKSSRIIYFRTFGCFTSEKTKCFACMLWLANWLWHILRLLFSVELRFPPFVWISMHICKYLCAVGAHISEAIWLVSVCAAQSEYKNIENSLHTHTNHTLYANNNSDRIAMVHGCNKVKGVLCWDLDREMKTLF